jgi:site-specific DNA-methyltransferase (adenine-specific)
VGSSLPINQIVNGDAYWILRQFPAESVDMILTSPPYWALRDYGVGGQIGCEPSVEDYLLALSEVFEAARRVLKNHGPVG